MRKWLLRWYWTLAVAPVALLVGIGAHRTLIGDKIGTVSFWLLVGSIAGTFALSLVTLSVSLLGFPVLTRRFAPSPIGRWPLYGALAALTTGTLLSSILFAATLYPLACGPSEPVSLCMRSGSV